METQDKIYFLPVPNEVEFEGGSLTPVPTFDEEYERLKSQLNAEDGYFYYFDPHPLFRLPASHVLTVTKPCMGNFRQEDGAFLMHLAGYLYGHRLQFHDWWVDNRLPISTPTHHVIVSNAENARFFSAAYERWRTWDESHRRFFINILFMHCRAPVYCWDWERFTFEYMVTDALFKHAKEIFGVPNTGGHGERIMNMCRHFGLQTVPPVYCVEPPAEIARLQAHDTIIAEIVKLRNFLQHEAMWHNYSPGSPGQPIPHWHEFILRGINQRLIAAMLDFKGKYTASDWRLWQYQKVFE